MKLNWFDEWATLMRAADPADAGLAKGWADDVLAFWFDELEPADWFKKSDETDRVIGQRFLKLYHAVSQTSDHDLNASPTVSLAAIIVLDQFPRNMFRGHPQSFATDGKALEIAKQAVAAGFDQDVDAAKRVFFYLPFEHSEILADQEHAVGLIVPLGDAEFTRYALAHRDVIQKFGRFPHRNDVLGRPSTPSEIAYLAEPGSGF